MTFALECLVSWLQREGGLRTVDSITSPRVVLEYIAFQSTTRRMHCSHLQKAIKRLNIVQTIALFVFEETSLVNTLNVVKQ